MIYQNILQAMGNTPVIQLQRMVDADSARVLVKFEGLNVGGSTKTRTACAMIEEAERQGLLKPDSIIVEPTSGNQGIGLALVGAVKGYHTRIIMPDSVSEERRKLVKMYGAELILIHDEGNIGAAIEECMATANRMAKEDARVYLPQQFDNPANPMAHRNGTAKEILEQVENEIQGWRFGFWSRNMRRSSRKKRLVPICRWGSVTALFRKTWIRAFMTRSILLPTKKPLPPPVNWRPKKALCAVSPAAPM